MCSRCGSSVHSRWIFKSHQMGPITPITNSFCSAQACHRFQKWSSSLTRFFLNQYFHQELLRCRNHSLWSIIYKARQKCKDWIFEMGKHCDDDHHRQRWRWQWWWSLLSGLWGIGWIFRWPLTPTHNQSSINTDVVRKHTAHCFNAHCAPHTAHCRTNHKITDIVHCFRVLDKKTTQHHIAKCTAYNNTLNIVFCCIILYALNMRKSLHLILVLHFTQHALQCAVLQCFNPSLINVALEKSPFCFL